MKLRDSKLYLLVAVLYVLGCFNTYSSQHNSSTVIDELSTPSNSAGIRPNSVSIFDPHMLPPEIYLNVFSFLFKNLDVSGFSETCHHWNQICKDFLLRMNDHQKLIIIGNTGAGKSTVAHLLGGNKLKATFLESNLGNRYILNEDASIPAIKIVHDFVKIGTLNPNKVFDFKNRRVIWDCPGFDDPRGNDQRFINAIEIHKLLKGNLKVILVFDEGAFKINRGSNVTNLINNITEIFPNQEQLEQAVSFLVTKSTKEGNARLYFQQYISENPKFLTEAGKILIKSFLARPNHLADFIAPQQLGTYELSPALIQFLSNKDYVASPTISAPLKESIFEGRWSSKDGHNWNALF